MFNMVKTNQEQESYNINVTVDHTLYWKLREETTKRQQEFHQTCRELWEEGLGGKK